MPLIMHPRNDLSKVAHSLKQQSLQALTSRNRKVQAQKSIMKFGSRKMGQLFKAVKQEQYVGEVILSQEELVEFVKRFAADKVELQEQIEEMRKAYLQMNASMTEQLKTSQDRQRKYQETIRQQAKALSQAQQRNNAQIMHKDKQVLDLTNQLQRLQSKIQQQCLEASQIEKLLKIKETVISKLQWEMQRISVGKSAHNEKREGIKGLILTRPNKEITTLNRNYSTNLRVDIHHRNSSKSANQLYKQHAQPLKVHTVAPISSINLNSPHDQSIMQQYEIEKIITKTHSLSSLKAHSQHQLVQVKASNRGMGQEASKNRDNMIFESAFNY